MKVHTAPHWLGYTRALIRDDIGWWNLTLAGLYLALGISIVVKVVW